MAKTADPIEAPAESATEAAPESPSSFEDTMLTLLTQMSAQITALGERVEQVEQQAGPRFVTPPHLANTVAADRTRSLEGAVADGIPKSQTIPLFPNGQRVPDLVMAQYRPKFDTGDTVMLNLDAVPVGRTDGRTRGELMAEKQVPNGYGLVLNRAFLSARQGKGWKYRVKFDKSVMPGSNGGITYLYEQELVPA